MRRNISKLALLLLPLLFNFNLQTPAQAEDAVTSSGGIRAAQQLSEAFETVAQRITPSVVNISASKKMPVRVANKPGEDPLLEHFRDFFGDEFGDHSRAPREPGSGGGMQQGMGTGVIIDTQGHILTNNHVVGDADELSVRLHDGRSFKATIVGKDPRSDLAVIKIDATNLKPAKLGNSENLKIGEWVVAVGNPFGLDNTVTAGIVSATGRSLLGGNQYEDFIQTDAAINPGNSGGPLVNLDCEVIGINSAIFSRSGGYMGIGFAIPSTMAKNVMESLIKTGKVVRGWLGVGIQNLTSDLAQSFNFDGTDGSLIGHVQEGSPAEKAGLRQGDIIIGLNGELTPNINQLRNRIASLEPGSNQTIDVMRDGKKLSITVAVGELPNEEEAQQQPKEEQAYLGLELEPLTSELARRLESSQKDGLVVTGVDPDGIAARAGIRPKDIILSVQGEAVNSIREFRSLVDEKALKKGVRLVVESEGMERFVFLKNAE